MLNNLGSNLSDTLKKKIWDNEYMDFHSFLPDSPEKVKKIPLVIQSLENPVIEIEDKNKKSLTLDEWVSAFSVYMTIYMEKFKDCGAAMLKYLDVIRDIAKRRGDWAHYDSKFRQSKLQLKLTWGVVHQELCIICNSFHLTKFTDEYYKYF